MLSKFLGLKAKAKVIDKVQQAVSTTGEILMRFDVDFRRIILKSGPLEGAEDQVDDFSGRLYFIDQWGIRWGKGSLYYDMIDHPLKDALIEDLDKYPWPDPHRQEIYEGLEEQAKELCENTDYAVVAPSLGASLFELCSWLRGFQTFTIDMYERPDFVDALLDRLLGIFLDFMKNTLTG